MNHANINIPICGFWLARARSTFTLEVSSDNSHGRNSGAVVTLIRYSMTVSLQSHTESIINTPEHNNAS